MNLKPLTLPLLLLLSAASLGCLWIHGTTLSGHRVSINESHLPQKLREAQASSLRNLRLSFAPSDTDKPAQLAENQALEHILNGRFPAAIPLLEKAESLVPGNYSTAANLGTAYELVGRNADALRLIREAMRLNPGSHEGTEWVHELILVRKVENETTGHLSKLPLIPLPDSFEPSTQVQAGGTAREVKHIRQAIEYQLLERMMLVKPRDPYVADLLLALALIEARIHTLETAGELLEMASEYGHPDIEQLARLKAGYAEIISEAELRDNLKLAAYLALGAMVLGGYITLRLRIRRRLRTA